MRDGRAAKPAERSRDERAEGAGGADSRIIDSGFTPCQADMARCKIYTIIKYKSVTYRGGTSHFTALSVTRKTRREGTLSAIELRKILQLPEQKSVSLKKIVLLI